MIEVLKREFKAEPSISTLTDEQALPAVEYTTYYWNKNDLEITIRKGRTIPWRETEEIEETWSLKYNNFIISNILENLYEYDLNPS